MPTPSELSSFASGLRPLSASRNVRLLSCALSFVRSLALDCTHPHLLGVIQDEEEEEETVLSTVKLFKDKRAKKGGKTVAMQIKLSGSGAGTAASPIPSHTNNTNNNNNGASATSSAAAANNNNNGNGASVITGKKRPLSEENGEESDGADESHAVKRARAVL